jgi:alkylhydroperoxidase family enzyme
LPPGTVGELSVDCWSTSVVFNKGHRIGLHVSSSNWPRYEVNPNTGEDLPKYTGQNEQGDYLIDPASLRVARNTVFLSKDHASVLILPVRPRASRQSVNLQPRGASVTSEHSARRPRPTQARIAPARKETWNSAQKEILEPLEKADRLWNVFSTIANHPDLYREWTTFASSILRKSTLPPRDREILILRIGWLCQAEYEWGQHVRLGKRAGLTDDDLARIRQGPTAAGLGELDRLLLTATDELHADACISDATWAALSKHYDTRQMMDVVFTVGEYNLVSMALNSFGVQLDEGLEGFPK